MVLVVVLIRPYRRHQHMSVAAACSSCVAIVLADVKVYEMCKHERPFVRHFDRKCSMRACVIVTGCVMTQVYEMYINIVMYIVDSARHDYV